MARIEQDVTYDSFEAFERDVKDLLKRGADPEFTIDEWKAVHDWLKELHGEYFASRIGPNRKTWPPNAALTIKLKGHGRVLIETLKLKRSLTEDQTTEAIRQFDLKELVFGTKREWAWTHQEGSGVPERQHTGIPNDETDFLADLVGDAIVDLMMK